MADKISKESEFLPHLIAWEVTRSCKLNCKHCRAAAQCRVYENELSTEQCFAVLDNVAGFARPIIILTGGEPMLRDDIYDIARHGHELGLRMVMAPCGMLIDDLAIGRMHDAGIQCISISLDGATAESHDSFRGTSGAFASAMTAVEVARKNHMPFQINTTITRHNISEVEEIMHLAEQLGAVTFNPFLLVPTGRGAELADQELSPQQYEQTLHWLNQQRGSIKIQMRVTCAPHYQRIIRQHPVEGATEGAGSKPAAHPTSAQEVESHSHSNHGAFSAGCMGGKSFAFISHVGKVQICGFLETEAGDLPENGFNFEAIWKNSPLFQAVRDVDHYRGKCGYCEYRRLCGGCRARAFAMTGDYLESEPFCVYEPQAKSKKPR